MTASEPHSLRVEQLLDRGRVELSERVSLEREAHALGWSVLHPAPNVMYMARAGWVVSVRWSADGVITVAMATEPGGLSWVRDQSTNGAGVGRWVSSVLQGRVCAECGEYRVAGDAHDCL
ncbi:hypothetical protein OG874_00095 [Nocardia sp. NBC_00565]|uniref:hypothetical protein n=1 Tax=Nocardia sp. NBC_00565 TaxID=2975993 RepID=UPI002E80A49A|nr:hypothetical protein [Nocardia sp. NBC_00565]WUC03654.1 hypothetical protein OG874_00095 [Nocardia sp. NBC_00565]